MRMFFIMVCLGLILSMAGCDTISSSSVVKVTDMHTTYPTGTSLVIEMTPNKNAETNKWYIIDVSYLGKGRCRTAVNWSQLEIQISKSKNVYMPLRQGEAETLYREGFSKLKSVFSISIEPKPVDDQTIQDFIKTGVVVIYH
jgi:hypothetical protein